MHRPGYRSMYRYCLLMSGLLALRSYSAFLAVDAGNTSVTQDASAAHPFASLDAAAIAAKPGDTLGAVAGVYAPVFRRSGKPRRSWPEFIPFPEAGGFSKHPPGNSRNPLGQQLRSGAPAHHESPLRFFVFSDEPD